MTNDIAETARAREVLAHSRVSYASKVGLRLRRAGLNDVAVPIETAIRARALSQEQTHDHEG